MIKEKDKNNKKFKKGINNEPLFSVAIITYNSSKYIIETLESIRKQTYPKIELIISDDCSKDNTLDKCRKWLEINKERFDRVKLISSNKNTGIPENCNRSVAESKGEWIRLLAGDDALFENAIELANSFILLNPHVHFFTSNKAIYRNIFSEEHLLEISNEGEVKNENNLGFFNLSASEQYRSLLYSNKISAVGFFYKKETMKKVGKFDKRIIFMEDLPMFLNITKRGFKIYFMDELTVKYRIHNESIRKHGSKEKSIFSNWYSKLRFFRKLYIFPNISGFGRFAHEYEYYRHYIMDNLGLNRNNFLGRSIYYLTGKISPMNLKSFYLKRKIN